MRFWQTAECVVKKGNDSTILMVGNVSGQVLTAISLFPLARIYGTAGFGEFGFALSLIQTVGLVSTMRLDLAVSIPREDEEASALTVFGALISVATSLLAMVALACGQWLLPDHLLAFQKPAALFIVGIGIFLVGIQQLAIQLCLRTHALRIVAYAFLLQAIFSVVVQMLAEPVMGNLGLPFGYIVGILVSNLLLAPVVLRQLSAQPHSGIGAIRKKYTTFALRSSMGSILSSASNYLPLLFFGLVYSIDSAGVFLVAFRLISMPIDLVGRAISQIVIARASAKVRSCSSMLTTVAAMNRGVWRLSVLPIMAVVIAAPVALPLFFTDQWSALGTYVFVLAIASMVQFASSTLSNVMYAIRTEGKIVNLQLLLLLMRIAGLCGGLAWSIPLPAIILFSLGSSIAYAVTLDCTFSTCGGRTRDWVLPALDELRRALPIAIFCVVLRWFFPVDSFTGRALLLGCLLIPLGFVWIRGLAVVPALLEGEEMGYTEATAEEATL